MKNISDRMQGHHRLCDEQYASAEAAVAEQDWETASTGWKAFAAELRRHIDDLEEGRLFPALEAAGGPAPPLLVMRSEHEQMRALLAQMDQALAARDSDEFLGLGETLMLLTQQHNMKEESILYPMMDQLLGDQTALLD